MSQLLAHLFGDYILQSDWMAQNKTKAHWPALVHALLYSLCFVPLCWVAGYWVTVAIPVTTVSIASTAATASTTTITAPLIAGSTGYQCWYLPATGATTQKRIPAHFRWLPWLVIFSTHFLIDRFRLARYVVWAKNWLGPWTQVAYVCSAHDFCQDHTSPECKYEWVTRDRLREIHPAIWKLDQFEFSRRKPTPPLADCPTGYPPTTPIWLSTWLLIIADNTLHLAINYAALRWL